jgi:hypothetical protein
MLLYGKAVAGIGEEYEMTKVEKPYCFGSG